VRLGGNKHQKTLGTLAPSVVKPLGISMPLNLKGFTTSNLWSFCGCKIISL